MRIGLHSEKTERPEEHIGAAKGLVVAKRRV